MCLSLPSATEIAAARTIAMGVPLAATFAGEATRIVALPKMRLDSFSAAARQSNLSSVRWFSAPFRVMTGGIAALSLAGHAMFAVSAAKSGDHAAAALAGAGAVGDAIAGASQLVPNGRFMVAGTLAGAGLSAAAGVALHFVD